jgi:hypothetical protein
MNPMVVTNLNHRWGRPTADFLVPFAFVKEETKEEEEEEEEAIDSGGSAWVTMY